MLTWKIGGCEVIVLIFDEGLEREVGFELVLGNDRVGHLIGDIILNILSHPPIVRLLEILHIMRDPIFFIVLLVNHILVFFVLAGVRFLFDLDLLLKLKRLGPLIDVGHVVSSFRWHADSLTVGDRETNLAESERAKRNALSPRARSLAWLWEGPVRLATRLAAQEVNRRAARARGHKP